MSKIAKVDKNFKVQASIDKSDVVFFSPQKAPFEINGVFYEEGKFRRLPEAVSKKTSEGVHALHANTAGGRIRFMTDSPYIAIAVKLGDLGKMPHFALTGSVGFDIYERKGSKETYLSTFVPPFDVKDEFSSVKDLGESVLRELCINLPLYSEVCEISIGLAEGARLLPPTPYRPLAPIVYYGSSITQGGCASRPGMSYQAIITRRFFRDHINLGFSGSAKGENEIANYIKELDMSLFVYDYDYNAPTLEHLISTHERMFKIIREKNPKLPIIIMSCPKPELNAERQKTFDVIKKTYDNARAAGDENVYFIPGPELCKHCGFDFSVDNCHPTDLGFFSMAKTLGDFMEEHNLA